MEPPQPQLLAPESELPQLPPLRDAAASLQRPDTFDADSAESLLGGARERYSQLSQRRRQQYAAAISMASPMQLAGREAAGEAGGPQRWAAELGLTRAASPAAAAAEAEAEGDAVYEARIKKLQCELILVRLEAEENLRNSVEVAARGKELAAAYRAEEAALAAEQIADARYDAQQDRVEALALAHTAQVQRLAGIQHGLRLRRHLARSETRPGALETELREHFAADGWGQAGESLPQMVRHAEAVVAANPRYRDIDCNDLVAARVYTAEVTAPRLLQAACRSMADYRFIQTDLDRPPREVAAMFFHLRSALHSLKGALDEEWLYRGEPQLPPDLHAVGQRVVWHEFKTVYSVDDIPRSVALGLRPASRAGARGAPSAAGVMYRIRPRPGRHFGNLGAKLFAGDPCVGFGGGEGSEHQVLLPPGVCFAVVEVDAGIVFERPTVVTLEYVGVWADEDTLETLEQVEATTAAAAQSMEEAVAQCHELKAEWERLYEEWRAAQVQVRRLGGSLDGEEMAGVAEVVAARRGGGAAETGVGDEGSAPAELGDRSDSGGGEDTAEVAAEADERPEAAGPAVEDRKEPQPQRQTPPPEQPRAAGQTQGPNLKAEKAAAAAAAAAVEGARGKRKPLHRKGILAGRQWGNSHEERMVLHLTSK